MRALYSRLGMEFSFSLSRYPFLSALLLESPSLISNAEYGVEFISVGSFWDSVEQGCSIAAVRTPMDAH